VASIAIWCVVGEGAFNNNKVSSCVLRLDGCAATTDQRRQHTSSESINAKFTSGKIKPLNCDTLFDGKRLDNKPLRIKTQTVFHNNFFLTNRCTCFLV